MILFRNFYIIFSMVEALTGEKLPFSQESSDVLYHATNEVKRQGINYRSIDHLVCGLLKDDNIQKKLNELGVDLEKINSAVCKSIRLTPGSHSVIGLIDNPGTTEEVLQLAAKESSQRGACQITPVDILIAVMTEGNNTAAKALRESGVTFDKPRISCYSMQNL